MVAVTLSAGRFYTKAEPALALFLHLHTSVAFAQAVDGWSRVDGGVCGEGAVETNQVSKGKAGTLEA